MSTKKLLSKRNFIELIKKNASERYPDRHPFNHLLYDGKLNQKQIHGWIINWFYYQQIIPLKDGAIIANCPLSDVRRIWISRILNYDGYSEVEGALDGWLRFAESTGLSRKEIMSSNYIPGVKIAADSLLNFVKNHSWFEGIATSLSQIFLPTAINKRINALSNHYADFVDTFNRLAIPKYLPHAFFVEGGALAVENALKVAFDWKVRKNLMVGKKYEKYFN